MNPLIYMHFPLLLCVGTQPDQQFYDTSLFSPVSGPFSVNNCTFVLTVLSASDAPVIDVALPGMKRVYWFQMCDYIIVA